MHVSNQTHYQFQNIATDLVKFEVVVSSCGLIIDCLSRAHISPYSALVLSAALEPKPEAPHRVHDRLLPPLIHPPSTPHHS